MMTREDGNRSEDRGSRRRGLFFLVLILAGVGIGVGFTLQPSIVATESSQPEQQGSHADSLSLEETTDGISGDAVSEDPPDTQTEALPETSVSSPDADTIAETDPDPAIPSGPRRTEIGYNVGQFAPGFSLVDLDGRRVSLASYRGQVVLLDFWASWCSPCRQTLPRLHRLAADLEGDGLVFIGINLDRRVEDAVSYLEDNPFHRMIPVQGTTAVAREYGVSGIPRTFVIDRSGVIRFAGHPAALGASAIEPWL